jgi:very-short-patch-repair endonuclease
MVARRRKAIAKAKTEPKAKAKAKAKPAGNKSLGSKGEIALAGQLDARGIGYERELMLIPGRRFRFDFLLAGDLIVEVEGGTWSGGRHTTGAGFRSDCFKYNAALELGYRVLRYTTDMVTKGEAIAQVERIVAAESAYNAL